MSSRNYIQPPSLPNTEYRRIFTDIYNRLNENYVNNRRLQAGPSSSFAKTMSDMLISGMDSQGVNILNADIVKNSTVERIEFANNVHDFKKNQKIRIVNKYTWERQTFTAAIDQVDAGDGTYYVDVLPAIAEHYFPQGSFAFYDPTMVSLGMLATRSALRLFAESNAIGEVTETANAGASVLNVNLWGFLSGGEALDIIIETIDNETSDLYFSKKTVYVANGVKYDSGIREIALSEPLKSTIPDGSYVKINGISLSSKFHVDPSGIKGTVERTLKANSIGVLQHDRSGTVNAIRVYGVESSVQLLHGQTLKIENEKGENENIVVNGNQTVTTGGSFYQIAINSKALQYTYNKDSAWVFESSQRLSGRLTIEAGKVALNATNITNNANATSSLTLDVTNLENAHAALQVSYNGTVTTVDEHGNSIDSLISAQAGLITQVGNLENLTDDQQTLLDSLGVTVGNLGDDVDNIIGNAAAQNVLYAAGGDNIATLNLVAGTTGSFAGMKASLIKLNDIAIDDNGAIYNTGTNGFDGGIVDGLIQGLGSKGWAIDRLGRIRGHDVDFRNSNFQGSFTGGITSTGATNHINIMTGDIQCDQSGTKFPNIEEGTGPGATTPTRFFIHLSHPTATVDGKTAYPVYWVKQTG